MAAALLCLGYPGSEPWQLGYRAPRGRVHVPLVAAARPTTLPKDQFEIRIQSQITNTEDDLWRVPMEARAGYGVFDDLELGIRLIRLSLNSADDTESGGLIAPTVYAAGRTVIERMELGGLIDIELPLEGFRATDLEGFFRFHFGEYAHLDIRGRAGILYEDGITTWPAQIPAELLANLTPRVALGLGTRIEWQDLGEIDLYSIRPKGRLLYTIGDVTKSPLWQLEAFLESSPTLQPDRSRRVGDIDQFSFGIRLVMFFDDPSNDDDGFDAYYY